MQTDMLVSGFPGRGYLGAATPMLVALCVHVSSISERNRISQGDWNAKTGASSMVVLFNSYQ